MQIIFSNLFKSFQIFSTLLRDVVTLHCEREKHSAKIWRSLHGNLPKSQLRTSNIEKHEKQVTQKSQKSQKRNIQHLKTRKTRKRENEHLKMRITRNIPRRKLRFQVQPNLNL